MGKHFLLLVATLLCLSLPSWAQDYPKAEGFAGFSVMNIDGGDRQSLYGFQASVAGNASSMLGLVADFGGQYKTIDDVDVKVHLYEYLFGPRINVRGEKGTGFVHFLLGGARFGGGGESDNAFAMGIGGGADVKVGSSNTAIRVFQFDWVPAHSNGEWEKKNVRVGFGIVFGG